MLWLSCCCCVCWKALFFGALSLMDKFVILQFITLFVILTWQSPLLNTFCHFFRLNNKRNVCTVNSSFKYSRHFLYTCVHTFAMLSINFLPYLRTISLLMFAIACLRLCMQSGKTQIKKLFLKSFEDGGSEPWGKAVLSHMGVNLKLSLVLFTALVGHF